MTVSTLPIYALDKRHNGLTSAVAENYLEAARVSLDRHHKSPQEFQLNHEKSEKRATVEWKPTNQRIRDAWANRDDATRDGAYALAIAAVELSMELFAVKRAETLTILNKNSGEFNKILTEYIKLSI